MGLDVKGFIVAASAQNCKRCILELETNLFQLKLTTDSHLIVMHSQWMSVIQLQKTSSQYSFVAMTVQQLLSRIYSFKLTTTGEDLFQKVKKTSCTLVVLISYVL